MTIRVVLATLLTASVLAALVSLTGCTATQNTPRFERPEVLPSFTETAARFNARVERLDRVWASTVVTIRTPKESGGTRIDQAEGYLQIEQPDKTSLSIMKLGETYFYLGSDDVGYWWLDLSDRERKVALYGLHAEATPAIVAELGLPVHPQELLDLFGLTRLPDRASGGTGSSAVAPGSSEWDEERGMIRVTLPAKWGTRALWLDPVTMAPQRAELRDARGRPRAVCDMARYTSVPVRGDGRVPPKIASQYRVEFPESQARATIELYGTMNKPISPRAFDFENLVESYGVDEVILLRPEEAAKGR
ncbi:MAG: hypothetical protein HND58_13780 [Planctomycetota bacterium]|nr:MAG: hypothetical protein HND58_13780 [Planctomycetota bacterium]